MASRLDFEFRITPIVRRNVHRHSP
jgi:hypothetical protein